MLNSTNLVRLVNEFILFLLGALLLLLAFTGRVGLPPRPWVLAAIGILFLYWGARAWARPEQRGNLLQSEIRAGSLALVGAAILAVPFFPVRFTAALLGIAGGVLVIRGLLAGALSLRRS
ncbi:MAG TPA: hypothetical protein VJR23_01165 [Candidatus Acidoferrales bacterium]|nr:hypothetical protein [Candidatus Acidoferrales bacterium]